MRNLLVAFLEVPRILLRNPELESLWGLNRSKFFNCLRFVLAFEEEEEKFIL